MARNITLTLGSNAGADLGPFNITVSTGTITPTTATKAEMMAGKVFSISSDDAVTVTTTSTGACTNNTTTSIAAATPPQIVTITWSHGSLNATAGEGNGSTLTISYTNSSGTGAVLTDSPPNDSYTTYNNGGTLEVLAGTNIDVEIQAYSPTGTNSTTSLNVAENQGATLYNESITAQGGTTLAYPLGGETFTVNFGTAYTISALTEISSQTGSGTGGNEGAPPIQN
jgi:hypothetical protein